MKRLVWIALLFGLALGGCVKTDSQDVTTRGIYADIGATANGTGTTTVHATLYFGSPIHLDFVQLTGDDALIATGAGVEKRMSESSFLNVVSHTASFGTDAEGEQFVVDFERSIDGGAPETIVTLPAKFVIDPAPATASRGSSLRLAWAPSTADAMRWEASGDCIELASGSIGSGSSVTIADGTFQKRMGATIPDDCTVTVAITRSKDGVLDSHYGKGGVAHGEQTRSVTFLSTP